jgi:iron-sulfur cluster assembly accessory protein
MQTKSTTSGAKGEAESLHLSEKCEEQLRRIFQREMKKSAEENSETKRETVLRIGVDGGGCAGFQYTFALIDEKDVVTGEDRVFVGRRFPEEAKVVCDEVSFEYLKGSTVDYAEEMIRSAFEVVKNPNAEQKCGCGVPFEAKF